MRWSEARLSSAVATMLVVGLPALLAGQEGTLLVNARMIAMTDPEVEVRDDHAVLVRGDSIEWVGPGIEAPSGDWRVVDLRGRYLLPGLADMHVHSATAEELRSYLRYGVTTVLHMGDQLGRFGGGTASLALRDQVAAGEILGPTLHVVGRVHAGGWEALGVEPGTPPEAAARQVLDAHADAGYDFFKVHNGIEDHVLKALAADGTMPVIGHLPFGLATDEQLASGLSMVAHAELFYYSLFFDVACLGDRSFWDCVGDIDPNEAEIPALAQAVAERVPFLTPNLSYVWRDLVFMTDPRSVFEDEEFQRLPPHVRRSWENDAPETRSSLESRVQDGAQRLRFLRTLTRTFAAEGVPLLMGTDSPLPGLFPGRSAHEDLRQMTLAGLSPAQALRTATRNAGDFIAHYLPDRRPFGRIEPGYRADFVVLEENPLEHIGALDTVRGVMLRGTWHTPGDLEGT